MPSSRLRAAAPVAGTLALGVFATLVRPGRRRPRHGRGPDTGARLPLPPARISGRVKTIIALAVLVIAVVGGLAGYAFKDRQERTARAVALTGGDPSRAEAHVLRYGCAGCHEIPGVRGPGGRVGPPLNDVARRVYVAGMVTNTPDNMIAWIVDPRAINPKTAMPVTGISRKEARDVAAYLYAH